MFLTMGLIHLEDMRQLISSQVRKNLKPLIQKMLLQNGIQETYSMPPFSEDSPNQTINMLRWSTVEIKLKILNQTPCISPSSIHLTKTQSIDKLLQTRYKGNNYQQELTKIK